MAADEGYDTCPVCGLPRNRDSYLPDGPEPKDGECQRHSQAELMAWMRSGGGGSS